LRLFGQFAQFEAVFYALEALIYTACHCVNIIDVRLRAKSLQAHGDDLVLDLAEAIFHPIHSLMYFLQELIHQLIAGFRHRALRHNLR